MGTLLGHIVPGTFFTFFAIWWGFCLSIKHFHLRHRTKSSRRSTLYQASTTFSCYCYSSTDALPLESYVKIACATVGMFGEFVTGFSHVYDEVFKRKLLTFGENNAQHMTMFLAFTLAALCELLVHWQYSLPKGIEFLANILAYGIEAFLFHFHLHGRNQIDIHVHTLLVYSIVFCVVAVVWEYNRPHQLLATYARIAGTFLQGVWFYAIGLILYFPSSDPYWTWLPTHGHMLLLTVVFMWIALSICVFLFFQSMIVWCILRQRHQSDDRDRYNEQITLNRMGYSSDNDDLRNDSQRIF